MAIPPPNFTKRMAGSQREVEVEPEPPPSVSLAQMAEITDSLLSLLPGAREVAQDGEGYWEPIGTLEGAKTEAEQARKYWDALAASSAENVPDKKDRVTRPRSIEVTECPACHSFWVVISGRSRTYPGGEKYGCRNLGTHGRRCPGVANVVRARY